MRIAFSGVQSTGKTTLIEHLKKDPEFSHFSFIVEIVRTLASQGIPINEQGTIDTQVLVLGEHMKNLFKDDVVLDRCLLDGVVYTIHTINSMENGHEYSWIKEYAHNLLNTFIHRYDVIFYIPPEFDIVPDGFRSRSLEYRKETEVIFNRILGRIESKVPIVILKGSVDERLVQIKSYLNKTGYSS